jgi:bacterial/archaeal transporter family protein
VAKKVLFPKWLIYSLLSLISYGIWGFLGKVGADLITASQMQIFYTIGTVPVAAVCLARLRFKVAAGKRGAAYSVLMGILAALGTLAFFGAMKHGSAGLVATITALYPALTVLLAVVVLKERLNRIQIPGLILAMIAIVILSL